MSRLALHVFQSSLQNQWALDSQNSKQNSITTVIFYEMLLDTKLTVDRETWAAKDGAFWAKKMLGYKS